MKSVLTSNLSRYCSKNKLNSVSLSERTGVSQRTTHRLLSDSVDERNPTIASIEAVSQGLNIPYWQLFMPDYPVDLMGAKEIEAVVRLYAACSTEARAKLLQHAIDVSRLDKLDKEGV